MLIHATLARRYSLIALQLVVLGSAFGVARLGAQGPTATILGTVTDMSGAAIPNAAVQVRNAGTGLSARPSLATRKDVSVSPI